MFKKFSKNDEGVSAVIGVILMVAITVILAAVIAAFVFGMVGNMGSTKNPSFTVVRTDANDVQVTLQNLGGATNVTNLVITQPATTPAFGTVSVGTVNGATTTGPTGGYAVGQAFPISGVPTNSNLVITAVVNGNTQIVVNTNI